MLSSIGLLFAFQQAIAPTTPATGDTVGYWQQEARYRIVARLDESREVLVATGELTYINNSPDTLREIYVHQHLNAFRPHSAWSSTDTREGRVRFQNLEDPDFAYERFTARPRVRAAGATAAQAVAVQVEYPGSPDSTVARFTLPRPLLPGDSIIVEFAWEARPSTLPRRQGRRGRHYDFAQWYPRVAVYDRLGWRPNPLVPAGEFYGEFGTFDVTLLVPADQVIGATGVPVEGDPGWQGALRWGAVHRQSTTYDDVPPAPPADVPAGHKRVRFLARDVHHFGWSTSPEYRYEGAAWVRPGAGPSVRFPVWDTIAVHVLYQPGDEATWGNGAVAQRTALALQWLESILGPYAYPQITALHRIEGGGTEFPMLMMNGSPSQGLILHELGHVFVHGILANNEWASGWIDEGFSSYQTAWAQGGTAQDRPLPNAPEYGRPDGYRGRAVLPTPLEASEMAQYQLQLTGAAEPIGTISHEFGEFSIYNQMIYTRASTMFGQLRDVLGDERFREMLQGLYRRWALKHIDELAIRREAERVYGSDLGWFFDQWVHRTGVVDYALDRVETERTGDGWVTTARVDRTGDYLHPMPVGVRTSDGWTIVRAEAQPDEQTVEIRTAAEPLEVRLDPHRTTDDWDRRNNAPPPGFWASLLGRSQRKPRNVFDWPFLQQVDRDRQLARWFPLVWRDGAGGVAVGLRTRSSYQGWVDRYEDVVAVSFGGDGRVDVDWVPGERVHLSFAGENPRVGRRVLEGLSYRAAWMDGIQLTSVAWEWDRSRYVFAPSTRTTIEVGALMAFADDSPILPLEWEHESVAEAHLSLAMRTPGDSPFAAAVRLAGGARFEGLGETIEDVPTLGYPRLELEASHLRMQLAGRAATFVRVYGGFADRAPRQRRIFLSSADPVSTFGNHWWRPRDGLLKEESLNFVPLGGGGLRGYQPLLAAERLASMNIEQAFRVARFGPGSGLGLWISAFADGGYVDSRASGSGDWLADAGVGLSVRGRLYDRDITIRADFPVYVEQPGLAGAGEDERVAFRWGFSFSDFW